MKVVIIGGGIGGLCAAIALKQAGIDFEIFEAATELKPIGAGIVLASNAMQVFEKMGIEGKIMEAGHEIENAISVDQSFKPITSLKVKEKVTKKYGIGSYAIHRGVLQKILINELDINKIHLNKRLNSLVQTENKVHLKFEDGTAADADIVIGADGIKSAVRKSIFGEVPLRYSGQTCWRGIVKLSMTPEMKSNSYEIWGNEGGSRFGMVPISENEVYFFTTFLTEAGGKDEPRKVKRKLLSIYSDFGDVAQQIIEARLEENIIRSDIYDFKPIKKWWTGRVVLIGDAAHATTPNLGQGACQAVEDAFVLAECLKENSTHQNAFEQFQNIRFEKAAHVVNMSWTLGSLTNIKNPFLQLIRNGLMRMIPESVSIKQLDKILRINY